MPRPSRPRLSRTIIADAAIARIRRYGDVTIPALAADLGVRPASLYHHLPGGKSAIMREVRRRLYASIDLAAIAAAGPTWRERLEAWMRAYRGATASAPAAVPMLVGAPVDDEPTLRIYESLFGILRDAGVPAARRVEVSAFVDAVVLGSSIDAASPVPLWRTAGHDLPELRDVAAPRDDDRRALAGLELGIAAVLHAVERVASERAVAPPR